MKLVFIYYDQFYNSYNKSFCSTLAYFHFAKYLVPSANLCLVYIQANTTAALTFTDNAILVVQITHIDLLNQKLYYYKYDDFLIFCITNLEKYNMRGILKAVINK